MIKISHGAVTLCLLLSCGIEPASSKRSQRSTQEKSEKKYRRLEEEKLLELLEGNDLDKEKNPIKNPIERVVKFYKTSARRKKYKTLDLDEHIGSAVLCLAAYFGDSAVVEALLRYGIPIDQRDKGGNTPLIWAAKTKNHALVKLLLEKGASPHVLNNAGTSPFIAAGEVADTRAVFFLIEKLMEQDTAQEDEAQTAVRWKALPWCVEYAKNYLRIPKDQDDQADNEYRTSEDVMLLTLVHLLLKNPLPQVTVNETNSNGDTALMLAVKKGKRELIKLLLRCGASVTSVNNEGRSPLSVVVEGRDHELIDLFVQQAAKQDKNNTVGYGPLAWAARYKEVLILRILLKSKGCVVDVRDKEESTPLLWAVSEGQHETAQMLLDAGANVNIKNKRGLSPMYIAAQKGDTEMLALLNSQEGVLEDADEYGWNALITAARYGHLDTVKSILAVQKELVNSKDTYGNTPLHVAARFGYLSIVQLLLEHGADVQLVNKHKWTPLYWAVRNKHAKVVRLLLDYGAKPSPQEEGFFMTYCEGTNVIRNFFA